MNTVVRVGGGGHKCPKGVSYNAVRQVEDLRAGARRMK